MAVLALLSLLTAVVALVVAALAWRSRRPRYDSGEADPLPEDVLGLRQEVATLREEGRYALRHLAVVRYDAFGDMGGHLSWSLALLDETGSGVVLTSIHGRSDARSYAKSIADWRCEQPLSPEEEEALEQARPRG